MFGGAPKTEPDREPVKTEAPTGRILRSLVEPPPPTFDEMFPPVRRGRKPGSKNKPKPEVAAVDPDVERPRRGRKPGSKNKPKTVPVLEAFTPSPEAIAAMRRYGFADDGAAEAPVAAIPPSAEPVAAVEPPARQRVRLRDRSAVIRRYVLDAEVRPGQPGSMRARRLARTAR